ncbi:MAG: hypothetical protein Q8P07_00065 [bacterium]|nr:hypothetical protein [bacterium]
MELVYTKPIVTAIGSFIAVKKSVRVWQTRAEVRVAGHFFRSKKIRINAMITSSNL